MIRLDHARRDVDGFQPRRTEAIHRRTRHGRWEARQQRGHARDVAVVLAGLVRGAEVGILDQCWVDAGSLHDGLDDVGGKIVGANRAAMRPRADRQVFGEP